MQKENLKQQSLNGLKVRTTNQDEMTEGKGKIGSLWQSFFETIAPNLKEDALIYGVYSNYESDHTGLFDVYAATNQPLNEQKVETVDINEGQYLKFHKTGEMPQAVIELWTEVWNYFSDDNCQHERAYTTDFELYKGLDEVEIAIAIK